MKTSKSFLENMDGFFYALENTFSLDDANPAALAPKPTRLTPSNAPGRRGGDNESELGDSGPAGANPIDVAVF